MKPKNALTGHSGAFPNASDQYFGSALKGDAFYVPAVAVGSSGVPPCGVAVGSGAPVCDIYETGFTTGQRNIFRQAFQKRADISLVKSVSFRERYAFKYSLDVYNLTNTSSFDIPSNEPNEGYYNESPSYDPGLSYDQNFKNQYPQDPTLGFVHSAIGSARQVQMTLHMSF